MHTGKKRLPYRIRLFRLPLLLLALAGIPSVRNVENFSNFSDFFLINLVDNWSPAVNNGALREMFLRLTIARYCSLLANEEESLLQMYVGGGIGERGKVFGEKLSNHSD